MMTVVGLIKGAQTVQGLIALVDQEQISSSLADLEMQAAKKAFEAIPRSVDKNAQTWTCIGHLNSAQEGYEHSILAPIVFPTFTRHARDDDAKVKRRFVLVLKALCYKYVGEDKLCNEAIRDAKAEVSKEMSLALALMFAAYAVVGSATLVAYAEAAYSSAKGIGDAGKQYGIDDDTLSRIAKILSG